MAENPQPNPAAKSPAPPAGQPAQPSAQPAAETPRARRGCVGTLFLLGIWLVALAGFAWSVVAVLHFPDFAEFQKIIFGAALGLATFVSLLLGRGLGRPVLLIFVTACVAGAFFNTPASHKREWSEEHAVLTTVELDGESAVLSHVRHNSHDPDRRTFEWSGRRVDLARVIGTDFIVQPFANWREPAAVMASFRLEGEPPLTVSLLPRREAGEEYSALNALFRQLELHLIFGAEKDLLGERGYHPDVDVHLYPSRLDPDQSRALLRDYLEEAAGLREHPRYFNAAWRNSFTTLVARLHRLGIIPVQPDWRLLAPGLEDDWLLRNGLLDFDGDLTAAREKFRIRELGIWQLDERGWSEMIRGQSE